MPYPVRYLACAVLLLTLAACANPSTPYRDATGAAGRGLGYSQQQIDGSTWRVQFAGNSATSREQVEDYLLYRSAEIMRDGGYDRFVLLEKVIEPVVRYWGADPFYGPHIGVGTYGRRSFGHWGFHQPVYNTQTRYKGTALIRVYRRGAPNGPVFSAKELLTRIGPRIVWPQSG